VLNFDNKLWCEIKIRLTRNHGGTAVNIPILCSSSNGSKKGVVKIITSLIQATIQKYLEKKNFKA